MRASAATWFINHGLPSFASRRAAHLSMLSRLAPLAVLIVVAQISILITSALMAVILRSPVFDVLERTSGAATKLSETDSAWAEVIALTTLSVPAAGLALSVFLAWLVSRQSRRVRKWVGAVGLALFICSPLLARLVADFSGVFSSSPLRILGWMAARIVTVVVLVVLVRAGVGAILSSAWARARSQVQNAAPLAAKALPVTILTFLFAYFSAETWQVTAGMSLPRLVSVVGILLALALALVVFTTSDRVDDIVKQGVAFSQHRQLFQEVCGIDAASFSVTRTGGEVEEPTFVPVTRMEKSNLVLLQAVAQLWQALLFALVVWVFLLGFSIAAIPPVTEVKWTGVDVQAFSVNDVTLPITVAHVKVCSLLAAVSALSFAGASATDDFYARSLQQDLDREVEQALVVKHLAHVAA